MIISGISDKKAKEERRHLVSFNVWNKSGDKNRDILDRVLDESKNEVSDMLQYIE